MLIAQISDLHFRARGVLLFGAVDACAGLENAIAHLNRLSPRPDAVIVTGDLVNDGGEEDYAQLAELLQGLPMPVYPIPGNHDVRELIRRHLAFTRILPAGGPLHYVVDKHPVRLVALDSLIEGEVGGRLGDDQLRWLDTTLAGEPDKPTLVFVHHPPFDTGIGFMDTIRLEDADAFAGVIRRHSQVELVTCGHVHRTVHTRFAGTVATIPPGTAHQVTLDLKPDAPASWVAEPTACMLHMWTPENGIVSHVSYIGDFGGPVLFE